METTTLTQAVLSVPGITCGHCERTISQALAPVAGVQRVAVDIPARRVTVDYDPGTVGVERLAAVLAAEEYPVAEVAMARPEDGSADQPATGGCSCCSPSQ